MHRFTYFIAVLASFAFQIAPLLNAQHEKAGDAATSKTLHALFESEWDYQMEQNPERASSLGDRRWNDRWRDDSLDAIRQRQEHAKQTLARVKQIDRSKLSSADQLNYDLFRKDLEEDIEESKFGMYLLPINQRGGIQTADELIERLRFQTVKDYEDWIARLQAFPTLMEQDLALMREGVKARIIWPKIVLDRVPAQIDKQIVASPEESPFYKPFKDFPKEIPPAERERLAKTPATRFHQGSFHRFKSSRVISAMNISRPHTIRSAYGKCRKVRSFIRF